MVHLYFPQSVFLAFVLEFDPNLRQVVLAVVFVQFKTVQYACLSLFIHQNAKIRQELDVARR